MKPSVIISDKEIMGGTPVFRGTRVPAQFLFDRLEHGESIDEFLESYPTVTKKQALEALRLAEKLIETLALKDENTTR